jgi:hypothetical protein
MQERLFRGASRPGFHTRSAADQQVARIERSEIRGLHFQIAQRFPHFALLNAGYKLLRYRSGTSSSRRSRPRRFCDPGYQPKNLIVASAKQQNCDAAHADRQVAHGNLKIMLRCDFLPEPVGWVS